MYASSMGGLALETETALPCKAEHPPPPPNQSIVGGCFLGEEGAGVEKAISKLFYWDVLIWRRMLHPKFARSDTLCSLQTREGEAGTGITTPSPRPQTFHTDERDFSHPKRPRFWEGKRQRSHLGCHSHFEASRVPGEQSCPSPIAPIHPSTCPGIPGLLLPNRAGGSKKGWGEPPAPFSPGIYPRAEAASLASSHKAPALHATGTE